MVEIIAEVIQSLKKEDNSSCIVKLLENLFLEYKLKLDLNSKKENNFEKDIYEDIGKM